jgi:hypothetical protein
VLDWTHTLALRAVDRGDSDDTPALRTLVASGLVERREDGGCVVTPAGRVALDDGTTRSSRIERILWPVGVVCVAILAIDIVARWVT